MTRKFNYFLVEGGETLRLCKEHIAKVREVQANNVSIAKELGAEKFMINLMTGAISGVMFIGDRHPDFKVPDRRNGACYPRKGTEWDKRLSSLKGYDKRGFGLADALGVPTVINYTYDKGYGSSIIGGGFNADVGFLWLSADGPFALYVLDVAGAVASHEAVGHVVDDAVKSWKPDFDGARPILKEEWELMVANHKLMEAKAAA